MLLLLRQLVAFTGVGVLAAAGHYGALVGAVEIFAVSPVTAALAGYLFGGVISYALNHRYTFRSRREHAAAVPRFVTVAGVGFLLTGLIMAIMTGALGLHYLLAQLVTTGIVLFWSFVANRLWTFREPMADAA